MSATGFKRLAIQRAADLAMERAKKAPGEGALFAKVAAGIRPHIAEDLQAGIAFARAAVDAMRAARGYDPAVHGRTDDEIADYLLEAAKAPRRLQP